MAAHGGAIFLASRPGRGTRARLVFPPDRIVDRIEGTTDPAAGPFVPIRIDPAPAAAVVGDAVRAAIRDTGRPASVAAE